MLPVKISNILLGRESQHRKLKQKLAISSNHKNDFAPSAPIAKAKHKTKLHLFIGSLLNTTASSTLVWKINPQDFYKQVERRKLKVILSLKRKLHPGPELPPI